MKAETRKNIFGVFEFYLGNKKLDTMVIGLLSDAEEFARKYLEGVDGYMANIDIFNYSLYVESVYKDLANE